MVNKFANKFITEISLHRNRIPMLFIHVIPGNNFRVIRPEFCSVFRIAFQIYAAEIFQIAKSEHLSADFKNERIGTKRKFFRN